LLPTSNGGIGVFAQALFAEDETVQQLGAKILMKVKQGSKAGQTAFSNLSEYFKY